MGETEVLHPRPMCSLRLVITNKSHVNSSFLIDTCTRKNRVLRINSMDLQIHIEYFFQVVDVQDQDPQFLNAPYSATVKENTPPVRENNMGPILPFFKHENFCAF